jgi:hypothetical protein
MNTASIKREASRLVEQLPDDATWEDLILQILVRQNVEKGLEDSLASRTTPVNEVRREYGLDS